MTAASLRLVDDQNTSHEVLHLRAEVTKWKRMFQSAQEELYAERDARLKFFTENKSLKARLVRQQAEDADNELVQTVFDFWVVMCKHGNARTKLGPAREKKV